MDVAFCAAGSHIKASLFNSQSPMVRLNGWHWNWRPVFILVDTHTHAHTLSFKNGYWHWLKSFSWILCNVASVWKILANAVGFTRVWWRDSTRKWMEWISRKYNCEHATKSTSRGTSHDVLLAHKKLPVKVLCTTVFKLVFLCYLCFHSRSPLEIKDCALNFMIASVNYREI